MKVPFSNKEKLKKQLKNKANKNLIIKFTSDKNLNIGKDILNMIQHFDKQDKTFMKNLLYSENSFILFLTKIIKK